MINHKLYKSGFQFLVMEINVLNKSKNEIEFEISSLTVAELLRSYLNQEAGVDFAAWKRPHPTKNPIVKVKSSSKDVKALVEKTIKNIVSEVEKFEADFKKAK